MNILTPMTIIVGAFGALLPCFQIGKMVRERDASGISLPMVVGGFVTNIVWTAYGFSQRKLELIGPDLVAVTVGVTYLSTVIALRIRADRAREEIQLSEEPTLILRPNDAEMPRLSLAASV
jgi:Kef-type K+ transport system membrane component KefB